MYTCAIPPAGNAPMYAVPGAGVSRRSNTLLECIPCPSESTTPFMGGKPTGALHFCPWATSRSPRSPPNFSHVFVSESLEKLTNCIAEHAMPLNVSRYLRRMRKIAGQPCSRPSSWLSQSSVLANRLCTTRTTHFPPARASMLHSVATVGEPGGPMVPSTTNRLGGSHDVIVEEESMPGPKLLTFCP